MMFFFHSAWLKTGHKYKKISDLTGVIKIMSFEFMKNINFKRIKSNLNARKRKILIDDNAFP